MTARAVIDRPYSCVFVVPSLQPFNIGAYRP